MTKVASFFFFFLFVLLQFSSAQPTLPTKWELYRAARDAGSLQIVYGSGDAHYASKYAAFFSQFTKGRRNQEIHVLRDDELSAKELSQGNCLLVGSPSSNRYIRQLSRQLPMQVDKKGIHFKHKSFQEQNQVLSLSYYPNPANIQIPIHLLSASNDEAVYQLLEQKYSSEEDYFNWSSWGYELYDQGWRVLLGNFKESDWSIDSLEQFDFSAAKDTLLTTEHFVFIGHNFQMDPALVANWAKACEANYQQLQLFTDNQKPLRKVKVHVYASAEEKGLMIANTSQAHCNHNRCELHTVINELYAPHFSNGENELILRQLLGQPKQHLLERGLSLHFSPQWNGEGADFWAARLFLSDNAISLADMLDNELFQKESDLVMGAMAASFVDFLLHKLGKEEFIRLYKDWTPTAAAVKTLEQEWLAYALQKAEKMKHRVAKRLKRSNIPYLKGFNFAHEGYQIYNGYLSHQATKALERLQGLEGNSVAIVPYSYMRNPQKPTFLPLMRNPGTENDESVIHSAFQAKQLGMSTMLKPQIWFSGSWPGDLEMKSEEDWQLFFDYYYRWIRHYALLAEIHQMDIFCVGVEFVKATLQREEDWVRLIKKIRGLYSGRLTYAANWGDEFEKSRLWDELDYIGINCYYPLSKKEKPSKKELKKNFAGVLEKIERVQQRYKKPVLFTEIGFRSVKEPWKNPHAEADGRDYAPEHQQRCYEVVFEGIAGKTWCEGIFWWKWPSYLGYRGTRNSSFTPSQKPAEKTIMKWFKQLNK